MYENKKESTIILACIIIILIFYFIYWIIKSIINKKELFRNGDSNSKREKMKRIYKSNEILDPDEIIMSNSDIDECDDPDGSCGADPDA